MFKHTCPLGLSVPLEVGPSLDGVGKPRGPGGSRPFPASRPPAGTPPLSRRACRLSLPSPNRTERGKRSLWHRPFVPPWDSVPSLGSEAEGGSGVGWSETGAGVREHPTRLRRSRPGHLEPVGAQSHLQSPHPSSPKLPLRVRVPSPDSPHAPTEPPATKGPAWPRRPPTTWSGHGGSSGSSLDSPPLS